MRVGSVVTDPRIHALTTLAIEGWANLVGYNEKGEITKKHPWSSWDIQDSTKALNESQKLDPTGLTTFMLLRGTVERYLKAKEFSAYDLILDPATIEAELVPMRALKAILEDETVVETIRDFQDQLRLAAIHYALAEERQEGFIKLVNDKFNLACIRKDALKSLETLQAHQFTQGEVDTKPARYNPDVSEFWNINSLLLALRAQGAPGISLCLMRDPVDALHSYFVFAVRNGDNITILTDQEEGPHPLANAMSRRPDRKLMARAQRNWFPYDLLDLTKHVNSRGSVTLTPTQRDQLVPINVCASVLAPIGQLQAEEFMWTTLMFDLIRDRFWHKAMRLPELSYTGEMLVEPHALVGVTSALVKSGQYTPLEVPFLKAADVTAETTIAQWKRKPTGFNTWLVERYKHLVPDATLNPVGAPAALLLEDEHGLATIDHWGDRKSVGLQTMAGTNFGTREKLERDRLWVARMNQATIIQKAAQEEYQRDKKAVLAWYQEKIEANKEAVLNACAHGTWVLPHFQAGDFVLFAEPDTEEYERQFNKHSFKEALSQATSRLGRWPQGMRACSKDARLCSFREGRYWCSELDTQATVFTVIQPSCPEALATITGVAVDELPWQLRHWYSSKPYQGNSILDRLDPEDWVIQNPWIPNHDGPRLLVGIALSKRALHARRQALGLPRREYKDKKEDDE